MAYNMTDRLKEWTSFAGAAISAVSIVIPELIPAGAWVHYWADAQLVMGAALIFIPQSAGTTAVENDALTLLQALSAKVPPEFAAAVQPAINLLVKATAQVGQPSPVPVAPPAPVVPATIVPAVPVTPVAAVPVTPAAPTSAVPPWAPPAAPAPAA